MVYNDSVIFHDKKLSIQNFFTPLIIGTPSYPRRPFDMERGDYMATNKGGRPKKEINKSTFEGLCEIQCTLDEIAGVFRCSPDTIERWCKRTYDEGFADTYKKYSAEGKSSLRRKQIKLAEKSAAMAIWLGKQYLGQRDRDIADAMDRSNGVLESLMALHKQNDNME